MKEAFHLWFSMSILNHFPLFKRDVELGRELFGRGDVIVSLSHYQCG